MNQFNATNKDAPRLDQLNAKRICLIKPSALGDIVQTLPLLPMLRERFPDARLSWVVNRQFAPILEGHPNLDEIIPFDRRAMWALPGAWLQFGKLLAGLRQQQFDLVLDLQGLMRTAIMTRATGAPVRLAMETHREGAALACHQVIPETGWRVPAYQRYWHVARALGAQTNEPHSHVAVGETDRQWAANELADLPGPIVAIHPGGRWPTKIWPVEHFARVAAHAVRQYGASLVPVGAPNEQHLAERLGELIKQAEPKARIHPLTGRSNLKQLAATLAASDLLLTNDSGPMHLAAAVNTLVVAPFLCTSPALSGPPESHHQLVATGVGCGGSYHKKCPYRGEAHFACMRELSPDRVMAGLDRAMQQQNLTSPPDDRPTPPVSAGGRPESLRIQR